MAAWDLFDLASSETIRLLSRQKLGSKVAPPGAATSLAPAMAAVSRAIVGHHPFDGDAVAGKPGERTVKKCHRALLAFVGQAPRCRPSARRRRCRHATHSLTGFARITIFVAVTPSLAGCILERLVAVWTLILQSEPEGPALISCAARLLRSDPTLPNLLLARVRAQRSSLDRADNGRYRR
jgi:hypothetical protein